MPGLTPKTKALQEAGYVYDFEREVYFNRRTRKAFSVEFIEDHSLRELEKSIREKNEGGGWRFYFNAQPSDTSRRDLEHALQ